MTPFGVFCTGAKPWVQRGRPGVWYVDVREALLSYEGKRKFALLHGVRLIISEVPKGLVRVQFDVGRDPCKKLASFILRGQIMLHGTECCWDMEVQPPADPLVVAYTTLDAVLLKILFGVWPVYVQRPDLQWDGRDADGFSDAHKNLQCLENLIERMGTRVSDVISKAKGYGLKIFRRAIQRPLVSSNFSPLLAVVTLAGTMVWPQQEAVADEELELQPLCEEDRPQQMIVRALMVALHGR